MSKLLRDKHKIQTKFYDYGILCFFLDMSPFGKCLSELLIEQIVNNKVGCKGENVEEIDRVS